MVERLVPTPDRYAQAHGAHDIRPGRFDRGQQLVPQRQARRDGGRRRASRAVRGAGFDARAADEAIAWASG